MSDRLFLYRKIDKDNFMKWDAEVIDSRIPLTFSRVRN
jgi:hypothetical protein